MTNSYTILSTRNEEPHGTGVEFRITTVKRKTHKDGTIEELPDYITSFVMVPPDQDIDKYLKDYLRQSGWEFE